MGHKYILWEVNLINQFVVLSFQIAPLCIFLLLFNAPKKGLS